VNADPKTTVSLSDDSEPQAAVHQPAAHSESLKAAQAQRPVTNIWLQRLRALLLVTLCATFGVLLVILPWTPKWTDNPLLLASPALRAFVSNGFVRGITSGLGLIDLWLGFWEAIHYHET
jgi:hypothetical protein